eukprot:5139942-Amphidinium_carterae.1
MTFYKANSEAVLAICSWEGNTNATTMLTALHDVSLDKLIVRPGLAKARWTCLCVTADAAPVWLPVAWLSC